MKYIILGVIALLLFTLFITRRVNIQVIGTPAVIDTTEVEHVDIIPQDDTHSIICYLLQDNLGNNSTRCYLIKK